MSTSGAGACFADTVILVDTSVWVAVFRDPQLQEGLQDWIHDSFYVLTRFSQMELLQGAEDEAEWKQLRDYLDSQIYLECSDSTWSDAARLYFDLRRAGETVRSPIDCCIAQLALEHAAILLHRDRDFRKIALVRPLQEEWF
jgi:predicted nucleic acid-binding protein